ncbi:MAG: S1 RNA-binding domain-containing protein [Armatimonadetes bacterium]|nr:S1 RNA-binding domain-containing protein [Armatimonadota bacterium]
MTDDNQTLNVAEGENQAATATASVATSPEAAPAAAVPAPDAPVPDATASEAPEAPAAAVEPTISAAPVEAPAAAPAVDASGKTENELLFEAALAGLESDEPGQKSHSPGGISKGERIEAKVIQVEKDRVFVDLGTKAEGVIPLNELTEDNADTAIGLVKPGDTFDVIVLRTNSAEGNPIVSKRRADFDMTWQRVLDAFETKEIFEAQVVERVKGGLVVDIGVRGFVPATHVGNGKLRNIDKYVGETMSVKIIEVDRERRKVVLSNKEAETERKEEVKDAIFNNVQPQDVLEGTVRRLTDYGAFVDLGGIDGLLHISEMSWARIEHPREVLTEGQKIKVMVLRLDPGNGRVSLGLRQVLPDPWNLIKENYKLGQKIQCKVGRMVQSGVFVRLPEGAEAFLPLSECSAKRLKKPSEELELNQDIEPIIIDLRPDERRMVLSLRPGATPGVDYGRAPGGAGQGFGGGDRGGMGRGPGGLGSRKPRPRPGGDFEAAPQQRTPTGGATIGERLGLLKGFLRSDGDDAVSDAKGSQPEAEDGKSEAPAE